MDWIALAVAFFGAGVAIFVPIFVEYSRRPILEIQRSDDLNIDYRQPEQRIVHIRVVNRALGGWRGKYLLRNSAAGCTVQITFISRSDGSRVSFPGRWSGQPEPWAYVSLGTVSVSGGAVTQVGRVPDDTKIPTTRVIDVSPGPAGQNVGIAIKTEGDAEAYGFASESYFAPMLSKPEWTLPHNEYDVEVVAEAGGIRSEVARFVLHNTGTTYTGLSLT
jgi:hypothetical protein